jgi:choline dehydrogenase-like flavoprotein
MPSSSRAAGGPSAQRRFRGERQAGFGPYDLNQRRGTRLSSARAFLNPVLKRPNLTVLSETLARRILFDRGRATGLEIEQAGERRVLQARREVVLCGGAINSPQLLMLSGIGPAAHLREKGIEVLCDLPGVGAHLQDHPTVHVAMENPSAESYALSPRTYGRILLSPLRYLLRRDGMLASNVAECGGFLCTDGSGRPISRSPFWWAQGQCARHPLRAWLYGADPVAAPQKRGIGASGQQRSRGQAGDRPQFLRRSL